MLYGGRNATITQLRGLPWIALDETGYVLRNVGSDDGGGGATSTWGTVGTYACRVDPRGVELGEIANQVNERTTHLISVKPGASITEKDRFVIAGVTFEITAVRSRTDEQIRELEAVKA